MSSRSFVAMLAAVLLELAPASSASADCAWVLWASPPDNSWYRVIEGYETLKSCDLRAAQLNKEASEKAKTQQPAFVHLCVPESIDPRGSKAGGR